MMLYFIAIKLITDLRQLVKKSGQFTLRLTVRGGGGVSHLGPDHKQMWTFWFFHWYLIFWHSKHVLSHCEGSQKCIFRALFAVVKMRGRPLASDDPKGPASCKWSSGGASLLQMMFRRDWPLTNSHPEGSSSKRRNWGFQELHGNWLYLV